MISSSHQSTGLTVVALAAMSLDGKITFHDQPGNGFTSEADKKHFVEALSEFDSTVLGRTTFEASREFILARLSEERIRIVVTSKPDEFAHHAVPGQLEFSAASPKEVLKGLASRGYRRCVHLGGSDAYASFQASACIDEWWVSLEPRIFGSGRPLCSGVHDTQLTLLSAERLQGSDTLLLKYKVI